MPSRLSSPRPPKTRSPAARGTSSSPAAGPASGRKRVMVVDDHPMTRSGLAVLINHQPDLEVCCEAGNPSEAIEQLGKLVPDLIVTDMTMPGRAGVEFIKDLQAMYPDLPILVVSMHDEDVHGERALRAGARGYLMKDAGAAKMLEAIRHVLAGQVYVSPGMSARLLDALTGRRPRGSHSPIERLSDREFEIFQLIGQGRSTREIARQLHLSPKTVDVHRGHLKEKLELRDATSLIRYAVRWVETQESGA